MTGSARGNRRSPACHQNPVFLTLSIVTLPVAPKILVTRDDYAHQADVSAASCWLQRSMCTNKKAGNRLDDDVDVTHAQFTYAHLCVGLYAATPVCYAA